MSTMEIANSLPMWVACGIPVVLVIVQAVLFAVRAYQAGGKVGLTEKQMKTAIRSSAITSIGPSLVILSGMLTLLISVGAPMAWMRLSLIGSVMFEAIMAGIGAQQVGVTLGADPMTNQALAMAVWTMTICSIGWVIFATFSANRMDKIESKLAGGDEGKLMAITSSAVIGGFSAMCGQHLVSLNKNSLACVLGGVLMFMMIKISEKVPALKEWNLTIAIMLAMLITAVLP